MKIETVEKDVSPEYARKIDLTDRIRQRRKDRLREQREEAGTSGLKPIDVSQLKQ
jgi:hypothetical protein